jgi:hypothetical protein
LQKNLAAKRKLNLNDAVISLKQSALDEFKADRAIEELVFTGLVEYKEKTIKPINQVYWDYIINFIPAMPVTDDAEMFIFKMIKNSELSLRRIVQMKYEGRWHNEWQERILKSLSNDEKAKFEWTKQNVNKQYPLSPRPETLGLLDYFYLGQLLNFMLLNIAWDMFTHMFRDKRALEDIRKAIAPVRNDIAHFRNVPPKELERCRIACDDLLVILEKEFD